MWILFFLLFASAAHAWNVSASSLKEKLTAPMPGWMEERIQTDLAPFQSGIAKASLERTLSAVRQLQGGERAQLARIQLVQGKGRIVTGEAQNARLIRFLEALEYLHSLAPLPDLDLILSTADRYDRPLFLYATEAPVFPASKERGNAKVLLFPNRLFYPEREALFHRLSHLSIPWEQKCPAAFWRGSATGGEYTYWEWDFKPRPLLVLLSQQNPSLLDALFTENEIYGNLPWHIRDWFKRDRLIGPFVAPEEQLRYKYLIAVDGEAAADSLQWQLFSQCVLLKAESPQIEWFYGVLEPYVHYIPFKPNARDCTEKIHWLQANDQASYEMAQSAFRVANEVLLDEEIFLYAYHLFWAYAGLQR